VRVLAYDTHSYDREFLENANGGRHGLHFTTAQLDARTAVLARGFPPVCIFVNDEASAETLERLAAGGTRLIAQRSTGFNNIDLATAERLGITCMRVHVVLATVDSASGAHFRCSRRGSDVSGASSSAAC